MRTWQGLAVAASVAGAAHAATVQEAFDAASAAYAAGHWNEALGAYSAMEARLPARGRNIAIVRLRKGTALVRLDRWADGAGVLADALAQVPTGDASLAIDRYEGQMSLGVAEERLIDPVAASAAFRTAEAIAPDAAARVDALTSVARVEAYLDPAGAIAAIDAALPAAAASGKKLEAQLRTIRGRALLNAGQVAPARVELQRAVDLLGGLTTKVGITDLAARSDLAVAALLAGDKDGAKRYLAYSAAGTLEDGFDRGANMEPPDCGVATGLRPDDVAVVEFGIGADGTVAYAAPVYTSRPGPQVAEFARAVAGWSWAPARLAKIPLLFRAMTRLELRCSTAAERPSMTTRLDAAVRDWFAARHVATVSTGVLATDLGAARRGRAAAGTDFARAPFNFEIAGNAAAPEAERRAAAAAWSAAALAAGPPPMVRVAATLVAAPTGRSRTAVPAAALRLLDDPAIAADAAPLATLRLYLADAYLERRAYASAKPLIAAVTADDRLAPHDPLRVAALIRASVIAVAAGDLPAARAAFEASGLNEAQCSIADAEPAVVRRSASVGDYPLEAVQWHISGWAVTELDVNADGTTRNVRTTIAYPPFVFGPPTVKIEQRTRFT